ncbi:hypothetical protein DL764_007350 [Monosporascus ibericus]|uniref:Serine/threonine-protein kinase Tel1 n=1 Tax=Monosporascus ibericus TaxID=155417 RepID=A0A4Q4T1N2_9PEZI|nr:hypothetical protein DL764_007350 [Monosporascus ibericus]
MAPQGKEMSMAQALSSIESGSKTDRARGLDELIYHFKKRTRAPDLTLEILFQCAVSEKSAYYSSKKTVKTAAATTAARLVRCAEALRLAVEHGASKLRRKTLLAVVDHIIQTLPGPNEDLVQPLFQDYIKALVALLGHAPNVELLATYDSEGWFSCVDFALRIIDQYVQAGESDSGPSRASPAPGTGRVALSLTASTLSSTAGSSQRSGSRVYRTHLQDLVQCLVSLSHASNAPLVQRSAEISSAVLQVLQLRSWGISQLHQLAFSVINALLVLTQTEDSMQASSLAIDSIPLVSYWWQARSASEDDALLNGVRNEMLNVVYNSHLQLEAIVKQGSDTSVLDHVESLADTLWSEYSRREDRAQLQQDDLAYSTSPKASSIFSLEAFSLRPFSIEAEKKWAVVQILALLEGLVRKSSSPVKASADDERPRKRNLPDRLDQPQEQQDIELGLNRMRKQVAKARELSGLWKQSWQFAARSVTMTGTCRASSLLLYSVLTNDLLPYRDIADDVNAMITTADVNGPAVVVDSSLLFMTKLLHLLNYQLPSASYATCNHVVRWMFLRWDPEWPQATAGPVGQAWSSFQEREEIVRYLLLLDGGAAAAPVRSTGQAMVTASAMQVTDASNTHATKKLVSELFLPKLEEVEALCDTWLRRGDGPSHITPEKLQSTLYCLIFGTFILPQLIEVNSRQSSELEQRLFTVFERVAEAISLATENDSLYERLLTTIHPYLPRLTNTDLAQLTKEWSYLHRLFSESSAAMLGDLYSYFLRAGLSNNLLSPKVQMSLSRLLLHLTQADGRFLESLKMPTATTSLLNILQNGSIPVKFYIGCRLPTMFGRYILKIHDEVFVDVLKRLPIDSDFIEGISLRLFVLAELAREWPTLLRRCVYHIFETPGNIAASKPHATYCLRKVSDSLKLDNPRMLFDLFAPQLIYTWLEKSPVETIPFEIFGFDRLEELLERAQSEVIALMVMRGQGGSMADLATWLGVDLKQLLVDNFSKVIAYSMAHDISIPKTEHYQSGESRVWKILGRETFVERIYINFVNIIGLFFSLIDQENPVENSWAKDEAFTYAAKTMDEIKKCGHSDVVLLPNQQPMFRAKYLTREISLLCSRTEYEMPSLWTPALVAAVARKLFNGIHHALGPLHSCAVLRKIRVLVCLAGPHAFESYPLEMLLHSIRPLVTNSECADDALGLSRYLLTRGSKELSQSPSFVAGYALSTLASLRAFFETSQSSTTQESQFKATMSKAQQFHAWFRKYLDDYQSPLLKSNTQRDAFRTITQSAANIRTSGNAERDTHESKLLLAIFQDEISGLHLLNEPSRRLAMEMLCGKFQIPASLTVDVVGSDQSAKDLATAVWRSCQTEGLSDEYLAWAGRVVGRAFAASGYIDQDLLRESELSQFRKTSLGEFASEQGILNLLQSLTTESDGRTSGLAESALRTIISEATSEDVNDLLAACQKVLSDQILVASDWGAYRAPPSDNLPVTPVLEDQVFSIEAFQDAKWAQHVTVYLVQAFPASIILHALPPILDNIIGFAQKAFPYILHLVLLLERDGHQSVRRRLSAALQAWFQLDSQIAVENMTLLMNAILYLRTQRLPGESSIADRAQWLDIDLPSVAAAATKCGMFKTALLFVELANSETSRASRRSSAIRVQESTELLMNIFENIDDPDTYYGLSQTSSLSNVLARLEYEKDGSKSLAFRGAQYDSHIRRRDAQAANIDTAVDSTFNTARRLEIWNLPAPTSTDNPSVTLYKAYQRCYHATDLDAARKAIYTGFSQTVRNLVRADLGPSRLRHSLGAVAALTEFDDALSASDSAQLTELLSTFSSRSGWMKSGRYDEVSQILSCRETTLSLLTQNSDLRTSSSVKHPETRLLEVQSMPCADLGLYLDAAVKIEAANSLWDHGEMMSSIHMLQAVDGDPNLKKQSIPVSRPDLLAKIGHQISVARLEKPESIQKNYLQPALKELRGRTDGQEAGKVYHQFAMFCDEQLQNSDSLEDLARLKHLRKGKSDEVTQLRGLISTAKDSQVRNKYQSHLAKAKQWLDLDEQELRRVEQSRSEFVRLSLENYLLSLVASDEHNNDALRFTALWLERSGEEFTNEAVRKHLDKVATRKFAPLMNQLTSRLLDQNNLFQKLLIDLVYRICVDHPYHGMYSIWSGTKARTNLKDDVAVLRQKATEKVGKRLAQTESSAPLWTALDKTSKAYHALAVDRDPSRYKAGQKIAVQSSSAGHKLSTELARYRIPPPTMQIELSADRDYSHIPYITKIEPNMTIASGVSAPKIITAIGSNGGRYKQLVKGGNDDLRQDAIMEQVFAAVSSVLKHHRSTQQRNLGIRTYKVLPLTSASGLIEFVPNTIPLHEYLMPAHERYHPKDLKGSQCRKEISQAQNKSTETRLATYKRVTERFQPVMRYFFMEYFVDPDDWFAKRTAYTRTTAAISILGHVLGLGDRHGHNILLDSKTGEVVHIDLGVAFEMGRVLPVPELVPFRLTRDIADGMGVTKTEGVFRRCCEFTLDALREETYSIMTILDVLRYDPLYSWSISPVRMAKLQDTRRDDEAAGDVESDVDAAAKRRKGGGAGGVGAGVVNEPSEADRALEVVRKKLSKTLSVTATVNDLINQATDEKNLAVLYSGWAAYA